MAAIERIVVPVTLDVEGLKQDMLAFNKQLEQFVVDVNEAIGNFYSDLSRMQNEQAEGLNRSASQVSEKADHCSE